MSTYLDHHPKRPLSFCHAFYGDTVHSPKSVPAALRNVPMSSGMTQGSSVKAALKGQWLFARLCTCADSPAYSVYFPISVFASRRERVKKE